MPDPDTSKIDRGALAAAVACFVTWGLCPLLFQAVGAGGRRFVGGRGLAHRGRGADRGPVRAVDRPVAGGRGGARNPRTLVALLPRAGS